MVDKPCLSFQDGKVLILYNRLTGPSGYHRDKLSSCLLPLPIKSMLRKLCKLYGMLGSTRK